MNRVLRLKASTIGPRMRKSCGDILRKFLELNMVRDTFIRDHGRASLEINKEDNEQGHQVWSAVVTESCAASVTISRH